MKTKRGLNGCVLKWIAIILMAIDHFGASILENFLLNVWDVSPLGDLLRDYPDYWDLVLMADRVIRKIGRPAFPVFCFFIVEGFCHTRNVKNYAVRLGIFALISEVPFDLAIFGTPFHWGHQNVFFTLFLGLLLIWYLRDVSTSKEWSLAGALAVCCAAEVLHVDYGAFGVALIGVYYILRELPVLQAGAGAILSAWEMPAPLGSLLLLFYNGERGRQPKWFFYWFYPVHLFLYYVIGTWVLPAWI